MPSEPIMLSQRDLEKRVYENKQEILRNQEYTKRVQSGQIRPESRSEILATLVNDRFIDGNVTLYPHGPVIGQGERSFFYRGEAEVYPSSKPSLFRELDLCNSKTERLVVCIVSKMREIVFQNLLERFKYVKRWKQTIGEPFYGAIAQHYGFCTEYLDITNDFNVALFFACCKWDRQANRFRTLSEEECNELDKGIIYQAPAFAGIALNCAEYIERPRFIPIGYQPFYRCQKQVGYVFRMKEGEDLKDYTVFTRYCFKHSRKLSEWIYELMDCGKAIYPDEALLLFDDEIKEIQQLTEFSSETLERALNETGNFDIKENIITILQSASFKTANKLYQKIIIKEDIREIKIPRQKINRFNLMTEKNDPERDNGIQLGSRLCYYSRNE